MKPTDITAALRAFTESVRGNVVSLDEFSRRAAICRTCPMRKLNQGFPTRVSQVLGALSSKYRVPQEIGNFSCRVCGCSFLLLLPATRENLHKDSAAEAAKRPENCWMKSLDKTVPP